MNILHDDPVQVRKLINAYTVRIGRLAKRLVKAKKKYLNGYLPVVREVKRKYSLLLTELASGIRTHNLSDEIRLDGILLFRKHDFLSFMNKTADQYNVEKLDDTDFGYFTKKYDPNEKMYSRFMQTFRRNFHSDVDNTFEQMNRNQQKYDEDKIQTSLKEETAAQEAAALRVRTDKAINYTQTQDYNQMVSSLQNQKQLNADQREMKRIVDTELSNSNKEIVQLNKRIKTSDEKNAKLQTKYSELLSRTSVNEEDSNLVLPESDGVSPQASNSTSSVEPALSTALHNENDGGFFNRKSQRRRIRRRGTASTTTNHRHNISSNKHKKIKRRTRSIITKGRI